MNFRVCILMTIFPTVFAPSARGDAPGPFNLLSESATLNVSGWAQVPPQPMTNYSFTSTGASINGGVQASSPGESATAYSSVQLDSTFSPDAICLSSQAYVDTGGGPDSNDTGQYCYADANYTFSLTFNVNSAGMYNLTFPDLHGFGRQHMLSQQFTFSSAENGVLVSQPELGPGYSGSLDPSDTFTISISEDLNADTADFFGNEWTQNLDFELMDVPEPSGTVLFGAGATMVALAVARRKLRSKAG